MLNMQNVKDIEITEGDVRTIHDKDNKLIWGRLAYDTKYAGDTKQQAYTGKNLFDISKVVSSTQVVNNNDGTLTINAPSGSSTAAAGQPNKLSDYCPNLKVDDIATLSFDTTGSEKYIYLYGTGANFLWGTSTGTHTKTITQAMLDAQVLFYASGSSTTATISNFQIELGSTPTDFEPYVGGFPVPNPDYPQDIHVVTGTQTITISDGTNSESYTINLGTTELCKIGDYQDYIYKNGDNWYVHKAITKIVLDGTESWSSLGTPPVFYIANPTPDFALTSNTPACDYFIGSDNYNTGPIPSDTICFTGESSAYKRLYVKYQSKFADLTSFTTWLASNTPTVYYALATPTDTQITDTNLITQLNNIHQFLTRYGYNSNVVGNLPIIINQTSL